MRVRKKVQRNSDEFATEIGLRVTSVTLPKRVNREDISRQSEDDVIYGLDANGATAIIATPYDLHSIAIIYEKSNILPQCVGAMVTNIASNGYKTVSITEEEKDNIDEGEKNLLNSFIKVANPEESLVSIYKKVVHQYEKYGFSFIEIIRNRKNKPSLIRHCKSPGIRLTKKTGEPVVISTTVIRGGTRSVVKEKKYFRKYIQEAGGSKTYFKEFGDSRRMSYKSGKYETKEAPIPKGEEATELLHRRQFSEDPYGIPRWISQLPSILGSREAEEVNLRYFEDNTVPPMILSVAGGRLTRTSFTELQELLQKQGVGKDRQNKIILIEAVPEVADIDGKGSVQLKIDKLSDARQSDGLFKEYDEANMAKVRSSFRLPPVVLGQSQDVTFACYDEETETLTDNGWVGIDEWKDGFKIACYDESSRTIRYKEPDNGILVYEVSNVSMYSIRSQQQDMLITPEHRILSATKKEGTWGVDPIENVAKRHRSYFRTTGKYDGALSLKNTVFEVPDSNYHGGVAALDSPIGSMPSSLFVEWLGYYLADGSIAQNGNAIRIGAKKVRKVIRFASLHEELEDLGFRVRVSEESAGTYFNVSHKGMAQWFKNNAGQGSEEKQIPRKVYEYGVDHLQTLFDSMMFCDGSWDNRPGRSSGAYSTVSVKLADDFQELSVLLGLRTVLRIDRPGSFGINPVYRVLLSERDTCQIHSNKHISRTSYSGRVYCFSVPTGVFITRRKGKIAFQGNTANVSVYLAEVQVFRPERADHDEWFNMNFVNNPKGLNLKTVKLESRGPSNTNPDQLVKTLTATNVMGGITPRSSIDAINETFSLNLPQYPEKEEEGYETWMDMPLALGQKILMAATQQTGEGENDDDDQDKKDQDIKDREKDGETNPEPVEHGQE